MTNVKTTVIGLAKFAGALVFVAIKLMNHLPFSDAEAGIVLLALGGAAGNILGADAKVEPPKQ